MNDVTRILDAIARGETRAAAELLPLVYDELRQLAAARMANEKPGHTLDATALVHEAYLRLVGESPHHQPGDPSPGRESGVQPRWDNRGHFFAAAAEAMRRILVESARRKQRDKHGGGLQRVDLDEAHPVAPDPRHDLIALDEALLRLASEDSQAAKLVELRYFAGLSIPEAAHALGISARSADRVWAYARAWLHREIIGGGGTAEK